MTSPVRRLDACEFGADLLLAVMVPHLAFQFVSRKARVHAVSQSASETDLFARQGSAYRQHACGSELLTVPKGWVGFRAADEVAAVRASSVHD